MSECPYCGSAKCCDHNLSLSKRIGSLCDEKDYLKKRIVELYSELEADNKTIAELEADNKAALDRLYDMYLGDDGQAWKEARKFLLAKGYIGEDDKPTQQPDSGEQENGH